MPKPSRDATVEEAMEKLHEFFFGEYDNDQVQLLYLKTIKVLAENQIAEIESKGNDSDDSESESD